MKGKVDQVMGTAVVTKEGNIQGMGQQHHRVPVRAVSLGEHRHDVVDAPFMDPGVFQYEGYRVPDKLMRVNTGVHQRGADRQYQTMDPQQSIT